MKKHRFINPTFFLAVLIGIAGVAFASPPAFAGWETENDLPPNTAAVSAETDQNQKFPETFKTELVSLINSKREDNGLSALKELRTLTDLADIRAGESAVSFSHIRPNLENCSTIYSDYGLTYSAAGENLSYGFSSPDKLVEAWMNSETHRANILNKKFIYVGIGLSVDEGGTLYCSQLFFTPREE